MSRRFGRQQKRKMRQEIQSVRDKADHLQRQCDELYAFNAKKDEIIKDVTNILGHGFFGLKPPEVELSDKREVKRMEQFNLPVFYSHDQFNAGPKDQLIDSTMDLVQQLSVLYVSKERKEYQSMTHVIFKCRGKTVGYALSDSALFNAPRDFLIHRIGKMMGVMMVDELRGQG